MSHFNLKKKSQNVTQNQERYKIVHGASVKLVSNWKQNMLYFIWKTLCKRRYYVNRPESVNFGIKYFTVRNIMQKRGDPLKMNFEGHQMKK